MPPTPRCCADLLLPPFALWCAAVRCGALCVACAPPPHTPTAPWPAGRKGAGCCESSPAQTRRAGKAAGRGGAAVREGPRQVGSGVVAASCRSCVAALCRTAAAARLALRALLQPLLCAERTANAPLLRLSPSPAYTWLAANRGRCRGCGSRGCLQRARQAQQRQQPTAAAASEPGGGARQQAGALAGRHLAAHGSCGALSWRRCRCRRACRDRDAGATHADDALGPAPLD